MKIQYRDYRLIPCDNTIDRFDMFRVVERTKQAKEGEEESKYEGEQNIGYGMSLSYCFSKMINQETQDSFGKDQVITMKEYLDQFKKEKEALVAYIESVTTIKIN